MIKKQDALLIRDGLKNLEKKIDEAILGTADEVVTIKYEDDKGLPRSIFLLIVKIYQEGGWEVKFTNNLEREGRVLKAEITLK